MKAGHLKKIAAVVLSLSIPVTALAGCGNSAKKDATQSATNAPAKRGSVTVAIHDRGQIPAEEGTMEDNRWTKYVNEKGPVDVKYVSIPRWEDTQKYQVLFAAGNAPDIIWSYDAAFKDSMYNSKNMMPLDDLIKGSKEYKALTDKYPDMLKLGRKPDGKEYEIVRASLAGTAQFVAVRGDWLKKLNLSVPKTPDEFYEVAKAFTQNDPDGNSKNDTFGFNLALPGQFATMTMFGWTAADQNRFRPYMVKDGKLVTIWDNIKDSIALQKKLYDAGATDKDFLVDKNGEKAKQDWINGKLGMVYINGGAYDMATLTAFRKNNPNAEIKLIPYIESKYGKFSWGAGSGMGTVGFINAACKDPKAAMQYIDFMNSAETMRYFTFGPEGVYFKTLPTGGISVVNNDKNKKEKNYNVDYGILFSGVVLGKEFDPYYRMDVTDPIQKEIVVASNEMKTVAFKDKIKAPTTIDSSMMPALPEDLTVKFNDGNKAVWDILNKAIVTPGYSADKAIEDAKAAWTKAGGDKVDEYYINYYDKNKANLLLTDDIYNQPYYLMDVK